MAQEQLQILMSNLFQGNFLTTDFNQQYDIIYSHRVAHLFTKTDQVEDFARNLASTVKPKGKIYISARDARGVKPQREGHQVNFWEESRFETVFKKDFLIEQFIKGEEIESKSNPQPTYFTMMIAERRPQT